MRPLTCRSLLYVVACAAALTTFPLFAPARGGESILMPFSCALKAGRPTLTGSAPTRHPITGERKKRNYRACKDSAGRDCKSMVVHSFKMRCGGAVVDWPELAAQIRSDDVGKSWVGDGQLNVILKMPDNGGSKRMARFVMPRGFAPIAELGARVETDAEAATKKTAAHLPPRGVDRGKGSSSSGRRITPRIDNAIVVQPMSDVAPVPAVLKSSRGEGLDTKGWQSAAYRGKGPSAADRGYSSTGLAGGIAGSGVNLIMVFMALAGTSLLAALGWFGRRYGFAAATSAPVIAMPLPALGSWGHRFSELTSGVGAKLRAHWVKFKWQRLRAGRTFEWPDASLANGARSAEILYERANAALMALGPASALRDTLSLELKGVRQRIDQLRGAAREPGKPTRLAASLRSVVRDLERIGRIAESAAASVKGGREELIMPKTRAQAFEVLGVNPDASAETLKRIVDALRVGWHPDHAKDGADKFLREERTKQINIAWDLIVGKRAT